MRHGWEGQKKGDIGLRGAEKEREGEGEMSECVSLSYLEDAYLLGGYDEQRG